MAASPQPVQKGKGKSIPWPWAEGEKRQPIGNRTIAQESVRMVFFPCKWLRTSALCPALVTQGFEVQHRLGCVCGVRHPPGTHH